MLRALTNALPSRIAHVLKMDLKRFERAFGADAIFAPFSSFWKGAGPRPGSGFEGASGGRRVSQLRPMPALNPAILASRGRLASVARGLVANNALAASGQSAWESGLVADGIKPQSAHPSVEMRVALHALWDRWVDRADRDGMLDFYGLQGVVARRLVTDGEAFAIMGHDSADGTLALRLIDAEQVSPDLSRDIGSWRVVSGVEYDREGRRVAYHLNPDRPGLPLSPSSGAPTVRLAADDVLHVMRVETPGQVRGLSWFTPVVLRLAGLDVAHDAQLMRQQIAAMLCGFVIEPNADRVPPAFSGGGEDGVGGIVDGLEPGTMRVLDPGQDVRFSTPAQIGAEVIDFMRVTAREVSAGIGVPYELVTGDLTQVNFSSARVSLMEFRRRCEALQHNVIVFQFCRRVWRRFVTTEILAGRFDAPGFERDPEPYLSARWMPPRFPWVDPLKDAQAEAVAIASGVMSRRQAVAARGYDLEVLDREIADDRARAAGLGLAFPGDSNPASIAAKANEVGSA